MMYMVSDSLSKLPDSLADIKRSVGAEHKIHSSSSATMSRSMGSKYFSIGECKGGSCEHPGATGTLPTWKDAPGCQRTTCVRSIVTAG